MSKPFNATVRLALGLSVALCTPGSFPAPEDPYAREILELVQEARIEAGLTPLERRPLLDAVARERARMVADLPHRERLTVDEPIGERLREVGAPRWRGVLLHLDLQRGYRYPTSTFFLKWKNHSGWPRVLGEQFQ